RRAARPTARRIVRPPVRRAQRRPMRRPNRAMRRRVVRQASPPGTAMAAQMLMTLLARPEVLRALLAATLGPAGRGTVPVARRQMRVGRILAGTAAAANGATEEAWDALGPLVEMVGADDAFSRAIAAEGWDDAAMDDDWDDADWAQDDWADESEEMA
ncbi:MAG: hypothetical protein AAF366_20055, partial [Pseudomonadota bacterium]